MFKESLEEGASSLEKASSVALAVAVAVLTGCWGSLIKEVILFYNITKYIILYSFLLKYLKYLKQIRVHSSGHPMTKRDHVN
jgi:hypothetical protein